ncbi:MAG: hypothetical protein ACU833_05100, partial [Gammaproteobacteria bacterium]
DEFVAAEGLEGSLVHAGQLLNYRFRRLVECEGRKSGGKPGGQGVPRVGIGRWRRRILRRPDGRGRPGRGHQRLWWLIR